MEPLVNPKRKRRNNLFPSLIKGQAVIELLVIWSVLMMTFLLSFQWMMAIGTRAYIHQKLYESLFCVAKGYSKSHCQKNLKTKVKRILAWGKIKHIQWRKKERKESVQWTGSLLWEFYIWNLHVKRTLTIPEDLL